MTANLDLIRGRQVLMYWTNKSGGSIIAGDVVIADTANNDAFTTTTSASYTGALGVAFESIANNALGRVIVSGYAPLVNVNASVTRGQYGKTHTVAKQATGVSSRQIGVFCQWLTGGTTPDAILFGMPDGSTGSAGAPGTPALTLSTTNSAGSAVTLVATDATIAAFDATVPAALGTAATGSAGTAARRDHVHPTFKYAVVREEQTSNTAAGTFTSGAYRTRVLNTELTDTGNIVSLSSNQFTPISGTYIIRGRAPAYAVDNHKCRIRNVTAGTTLAIGSTEYARSTASTQHMTHSTVETLLVANGTDAYELQHICTTTKATDGFGTQSALDTEVYSVVELIKIA